MDQHLKPSRFDGDHRSPAAPKEWEHWLRTFQNFIKAIEKKEPRESINQLDILLNFVSPNIYAYITDSTTFEQAIATLTSLFVKPCN